MKAVKTFSDNYTIYELTWNEQEETYAHSKYMLCPTFTDEVIKNKNSHELITQNIYMAKYVNNVAFCTTFKEAILAYKVMSLETLYRNLRSTIRDVIENVDELDRLFKECGEYKYY